MTTQHTERGEREKLIRELRECAESGDHSIHYGHELMLKAAALLAATLAREWVGLDEVREAIDNIPCDCSHSRRYDKGEHLTICPLFDLEVAVSKLREKNAGQPDAEDKAGGEADMRAICEALGFDPTNHHNAAKCPYCRPHPQPTAQKQD